MNLIMAHRRDAFKYTATKSSHILLLHQNPVLPWLLITMMIFRCWVEYVYKNVGSFTRLYNNTSSSSRSSSRSSSGRSIHTWADMFTVSELYLWGSSSSSTEWATEVFPVPTGPTSITGWWAFTREVTMKL